jgi:hypothetical protein
MLFQIRVYWFQNTSAAQAENILHYISLNIYSPHWKNTTSESYGTNEMTLCNANTFNTRSRFEKMGKFLLYSWVMLDKHPPESNSPVKLFVSPNTQIHNVTFIMRSRDKSCGRTSLPRMSSLRAKNSKQKSGMSIICKSGPMSDHFQIMAVKCKK